MRTQGCQRRASVSFIFSSAAHLLAQCSGELLAQSQVLERDLAMTADEERKEAEYVESERDHKPRL
jgi:hypothetical protein